MSDAKKTNVVLFPLHRMMQREDGSLTPPQTVQEVVDRMTGLRQYHIQESLEIIGEMLMQQLVLSGFNVGDETCAKDVTFIIEAIRSLMCKSNGLFHPFQEMVDATFFKEPHEEDFNLAEKINLKFTQQDVCSKIEAKPEKKRRKKRTKA